MEPRVQVNAMLTIEAKGWSLLAIYHSHPAGAPSEPSLSDVAQHRYPEALMMIVLPDRSARVFAFQEGLAMPISFCVL